MSSFLAFLLLMLGSTSAYVVGVAPTKGLVAASSSAQMMVATQVPERKGPLRWARGRVVATRNLFRKDEPKKAAQEADMSFTPFLDLAGALAASAATAAAATLDAVVTLDDKDK